MRRQSLRISAFLQADGQGLPPLLGLPNGRFQSGQHDSIRDWKMRFFNVVHELHCCEGSNVRAGVYNVTSGAPEQYWPDALPDAHQ